MGGAEKEDCRDKSDDCPQWARDGECGIQNQYIRAVCPQSCHLCDCYDSNRTCVQWAVDGECERNHDYMRIACRHSCGLCAKPFSEELLELGPEGVVLTVEGVGDISFGFYHKAAPNTAWHILHLFRWFCYDTNHIFHVEEGLLAQVCSVAAENLQKKPTEECVTEAARGVPSEFSSIPHTWGTLSMDVDKDAAIRGGASGSSASSFSIFLGDAPH